jgi:hypothetical protein
MPINKLLIRTHGGRPLPDVFLLQIKKLTHVQQEVVVSYADVDDPQFVMHSYAERINSAKLSFHYICDAYRLHPKVKSLVDNISLSYLSQLEKITSDKNCVKVVDEFLQHLIFVLVDQMKWQPDRALAVLTKAEEYAVLRQGRPILATVTSCPYQKRTYPDVGERQGFLLQLSVPEPGLSKEMAEEMLSTKPSSTKIPMWYQLMKEDERALFDYLIKDIHTVAQAQDLMVTASSKHRTIPMLPNFDEEIMAILDAAGNIIYHSLGWFRSSHVSPRDFISSKDGATQIRKKMTQDNIRHIIRQGFNRRIKLMANKTVDEVVADLENSFPVLLSTLISATSIVSASLVDKFLPDPTLFEDKQAAIDLVRREGVDVNIGGVTRTIKPTIFRTNHAQNYARHIPTNSMLDDGDTAFQMQRIIGFVPEGIARIGKNIINIELADQARVEALTKARDGVKADQGDVPVVDIYRRIKFVRQKNLEIRRESLKVEQQTEQLARNEEQRTRIMQLKKIPGHLMDLIGTVPTLSESLTSLINNRDNQRELHMAALEVFMMAQMDCIVQSSCVSGKDRAALLSMYVTACHVYWQLHADLPPFHEKDYRYEFSSLTSMFSSSDATYSSERAVFVRIFIDIFKTKHQQVLAGFNASGANGIKTPALYLPRDILGALSKELITESDTLANTNKLDALMSQPSKSVLFNVETLSPLKELFQLSIEQYMGSASAVLTSEPLTARAIDMADRLARVVNHPNWDTQGITTMSLKTPSGIQEVRDYFKHPLVRNYLNDERVLYVMVAISKFFQKKQTQTDTATRSGYTAHLYDTIGKLGEDLLHDEANQQFDEICQRLEVFKLPAGIPENEQRLSGTPL